MEIIVGNTICKTVIGGSDNLLQFDILKELREYLRVRPDGYGMTQAYRNHQWDGYRYFITPKGNFATGFLPMVCKFLDDIGVSIELIDERGAIPKLSDNLNPEIGRINGENWTARDYQIQAVQSLNNYIEVQGQKLYFPRGILDCATNAGKTSMAAVVLKNLPQDSKVLFLVSSRLIYSQAVEFFTQVVGYPVGEVKGKNTAFKNFTVAMSKTLYNRAKESMQVKMQLANLDVLILDESDEVGAKQYSALVKMINAPMRIFLSGTPLEAAKVNNMISVGLSGKVLFKITNKELIDKGVSQKPIVNILLNPTKLVGNLSYDTEKEKIVEQSVERIKVMAQAISKHPEGRILITFTTIAHGELIVEKLREFLPHESIELLHGSTPNREQVLQDFKDGNTRILVSSMVVKRGVNIDNIRVLIQAQGGKSAITVKQITGRSLRSDGSFDHVHIYDFYDKGRVVGKHSRDRIRLYKKEQFEVNLTYQSSRYKPV